MAAEVPFGREDPVGVIARQSQFRQSLQYAIRRPRRAERSTAMGLVAQCPERRRRRGRFCRHRAETARASHLLERIEERQRLPLRPRIAPRMTIDLARAQIARRDDLLPQPAQLTLDRRMSIAVRRRRRIASSFAIVIPPRGVGADDQAHAGVAHVFRVFHPHGVRIPEIHQGRLDAIVSKIGQCS